MTLEQAAQQALEALQWIKTGMGCNDIDATITALREALAQPQGEWVDLTDDEISLMASNDNPDDWHSLQAERDWLEAYEIGAKEGIAKFKGKNTPPVATQPVQIIDGVLYEAPLKQQGEWVDLEHEDMFAIYLRAKDGELDDYKMMEAVQAKFKEKNTPPVAPQGEPVAWMYKFKTEDPILCKVKRDWADNHSQWKETPLYTTPPSVEAAIEAALLKQQELWIQATEDGIEAAIEATKENESKVYHRLVESAVAHAIEATKAKVLECYSPDDTYQDWVDKIKEIK